MGIFRNRLGSTIASAKFSRAARLFLFAVILDGIINSTWQLFFNFFILARGFDKDYLGLVNSAPSIAYLVFGIPLGLLSDRLGRRRAMLLGVAIYTVAMGMQVLVPNPTVIFLMAIVSGIGSSLYIISQAPFMMQASTPENRALLFSLQYGVTTLSGAVGSLFAGQLPAFFGNLLRVTADSAQAYQAVLLLAVVLGAFALLPIFLIDEPRPAAKPANTERRSSVRETLLRPLVIRLCLPNLVIGFGAAILIPYMNLFFAERFQTSDQSLGVLFSITSLMLGVGSLLGPRLAEWLKGKIRTVVVTQSLSLAFLLLTGFSPFFSLAAVGYLMRATLMNMAFPLYSAFSMEQIEGKEQGTINSILTLSWQIGWAVGPYISGIVQDRYGFTPLFLATAVFYLLSIFMTWGFFHHRDSIQPGSPLPEGVLEESIRPS